jgi:cytochrome c553
LGRNRIALFNSAIQRRLASVRPRTAFGGLPAVHLPKLHSHLLGFASIFEVTSLQSPLPGQISRIEGFFCASLEGVTEMARWLIAIFIVASFAIAGVAQAAGNAAAGKDKAFACGGCHGDMGQGMGPYPALAGKPAAALVKALEDFKSGRVNSVMHGLTASLSDQDIENLAAYYASLK